LEEINNNKIKLLHSITQIQTTDIKVFNHSLATPKIFQAQSLKLKQEDLGLLVTRRQNL
jgi:hypothetical protein